MKTSRLAQIALVSLLTLSSTGCIIHIGGHKGDSNHQQSDLSSVLGNIVVDAHSEVSDVSTVNGNITIKNNVKANELDAVNGNIEIGSNAQIKSASTVNGSIEAKHGLKVNQGLSTVNGNIELKANAQIGSDINTVNGNIALLSANVGGHIETKNGDIDLRDATQVQGDIIFQAKDEKRGFKGELPTLSIDASSNVQGKIILHRQVVLEIENPALLAKIERHYADQ